MFAHPYFTSHSNIAGRHHRHPRGRQGRRQLRRVKDTRIHQCARSPVARATCWCPVGRVNLRSVRHPEPIIISWVTDRHFAPPETAFPQVLPASRSVGLSQWRVLIARTGFDTTTSVQHPTLGLKCDTSTSKSEKRGIFILAVGRCFRGDRA